MKTEALFMFTAAHRRFTFIAAALAILALPIAAHAQVGGVVGGVNGVLGIDNRRSYRSRHYRSRHYRSHRRHR
jgi:hypothetical protein